MRAVLSWLRDFAPLPEDPDVLAAAFDDLGLVVEGVERVGEGLGDVIVARVLQLRPHPDADRVQLVDVDTGGASPLQIVCGAFNFSVGDLVPLAPVGATLPGNFEIGAREVRGQRSNGMLCSSRELGLGDDHTGILVLPGDDGIEPGSRLVDALDLQPDIVFDLDVTPNRPDALSMAGIARDVAAKLNVPFTLPAPPPVLAGQSEASLVVRSKRHAPRFTGAVLEGVRVGPSPKWMARRLRMAGMRPINNLVDVSNYVMLELGQPNHPYDLDRLGGRGLMVRTAKKGETITTLDDVERVVGVDDCLICDAENVPVGIGGVMGGATAEIDGSTTTVLLENAYFDPTAIARTANRVGLRTEASVRFERGADHAGIDRAVARFVELAGEVAGARVRGGLLDVHGRLPKQPRPLVRISRVNDLLGTKLTADDVRGYLEPIGFASAPGRGGLRVTIPTWRPDATAEVDVIEEVGRHHGLSAIERRMPSASRVGGLTEHQRLRRQVGEVLVGAGLSEAWTNSFVAPEDLERAQIAERAVEVENPLVHEESRLRPSLLPGLLRALALNASHRYPDVGLFEIGNVFSPSPDGGVPTETERLAIAVSGQDAMTAARLWRRLTDSFRMRNPQLEERELRGLHPTRAAAVHVGSSPVAIGAMGEVDPAVLEAFDLKGRVAWLEVDLVPMLAARDAAPEYEPISRFPSSDIDLAFVVDDAIPAASVERVLRMAGVPLLVELALFDVFRGDQLGQGRRSLAYRLRFNASDHTLTDVEVAEVRARCIAAVETECGATLRG
jgi:phenylalanyl-tRNA synthetase beta chain